MLYLSVVNRWLSEVLSTLGGKFTRPLTKHDKVGEGVSTQSVCAVQARGHLTASEQSRDRGFLGFGIDDNTAHHIVCRRADFHRFFADVDACKFLELVVHGGQFLHDGFLTAMRNIEEGTAVGRATTGFDLFVDRLGHHVSGEQFWRSANGGEFPAHHFFDPLVGFFDGVGVVASEHLRHIIKHESAAFAVG